MQRTYEIQVQNDAQQKFEAKYEPFSCKRAMNNIYRTTCFAKRWNPLCARRWYGYFFVSKIAGRSLEFWKEASPCPGIYTRTKQIYLTLIPSPLYGNHQY